MGSKFLLVMGRPLRQIACGLLRGCAVLALLPALAHAQSAPAADTPAPAAAGQPARAPDHFFITAFDVTGVTRLLPSQIEAAVYRFAGPDRSGKDVEGARKAVQAAYAAAGYEAVVVQIPPQDTKLFREGVVTLTVNEAPVAHVAVVGAKHHGAKRLLGEMASIKPGEPLDLKALQANLLEVNRFPDRTVAPGFKPGTEPGSIDVDLKVDDKLPLHVTAGINDDHSPNTDPLRVDGSLRATDLWGRGHTVSASFVVAPQSPKQSTVFSGSYMAPFIGTPWSVLLYGYRSNSNVAALGGTTVLGNGYQIGLRGIYKLPVQTTSQSISFGFDFKNFKQNLLVDSANASSTPIEYVPAVVEYTIAGQGEHSQFDVTLGVTGGLRLIKKGQWQSCTDSLGDSYSCFVDQFNVKALNAKENFVHGNITANAQFSTKSDFVFKLGLSGQVADSHLVANEQFGLGGFGSLRGYMQSEAVADNGIDTQLDLQLPALTSQFGRFDNELRFYTFVDSGYTWLIPPVLANQTRHFFLLSAGGGVKLRLFDHLTGDLVAGVPLRSGPDSGKYDPRFTFQIKSEF